RRDLCGLRVKPITLELAIDGERSRHARLHLDRNVAQHSLADRARNVGVRRIESGQSVIQRWRQCRTNWLGQGEAGNLDGTERRDKVAALTALNKRYLPRDQRGKLLIADLRRHQDERHNAKAEGRYKTTPRPVTRYTHPPLLTQLYATILSSAEGAYMAQMRQFTSCLTNLAIALTAVLRRLRRRIIA